MKLSGGKFSCAVRIRKRKDVLILESTILLDWMGLSVSHVSNDPFATGEKGGQTNADVSVVSCDSFAGSV